MDHRRPTEVDDLDVAKARFEALRPTVT